MPDLVLGIATMNAGYGMPASSLNNLLDYMNNQVDKIIIIDGLMSPLAEEYYTEKQREFFNTQLIYLSNPWTGSLKAQYDLLLTHLNDGDWWIMLDDDEMPSSGLMTLLNNIKNNLTSNRPAFSGMLPNTVLSVATPRITCFPNTKNKTPLLGNFIDKGAIFLDSILTYYQGELAPSSPSDFYPNSPYARPRAHIFCIHPAMRFMASPAGRHVVPHYPGIPNSFYAILDPRINHYHLKAPEMYVYNDCVKAIYDNDIKDQNISNEYRNMLKSNGIYTDIDFYRTALSDAPLNDKFYEFCIKYKDHGAPEGRLFIWYYNICHPEKNPFPLQDWTASLKKVLNENWRKTYLDHYNNKSHIARVDRVTWYPIGKGEITL